MPYKLLCNKNGQLQSYWTIDCKVYYDPKYATHAPIGGLFYFDTLENAIEYIKDLIPNSLGIELWECQVENPREAPSSIAYYDEDILPFWHLINLDRTRQVPKGTMLADTIKITKKYGLMK